MPRFFCLTLTVLAISSWVPNTAFGQNNKVPQKAVPPPGQVNLQQPPDLPYIPPFPNAEYMLISSRPNDPGGPGFLLMFLTPNNPAQIMEFYKGAIAKNSWVLMPGATLQNMSAMRKNTNFCVSCYADKKGKTKVVVGYKIFAKETPEQ